MEKFQIGDRIVDPTLNRITSADGSTIQVEPKVMNVLVALAERCGELLTRDELMARVWNGVYVTDDALHRTIRELRRLFDDDADSPRVIETIRKRGYRLIAPIEQPAKIPQPGSGTRHGASHGARHRAWHLGVAVGAVVVAIAAVTRFTLRTPVAGADPLHVTFTPFTSDPGNEVDPALSASGKLAYVARGADGRAHIFTKATAESPAVQVTRGSAMERAPAWSPDEQRLAFVQTDGSGCQIVISGADGTNPRTVSACLSPDEFKMTWSADSTRLAVTAGRGRHGAPSHIALVAIADGKATAATTPPPGYVGDYAPAISPDGRSLAFVRVLSGGITSLCITPLDGTGAVTTLTSDDADVLGADWDPSGRHLIFSSDRAGAISIWRVAAQPQSVPQLIAGGGNKLKHPTVARRTGAIAYEDWQYEINLHEQSTSPDNDGGEGSSAISPTADRWNFHPQISPDGRRVAFQSTRSGSYEIWISNRDGADARQLTRSQTYKTMPRWSPDGRQIVFTVRNPRDRRDVVVADVESGATHTVASDGRALTFLAPSWASDGSRVNLGEPGLASVESRDGRWIYSTALDEPGIWRVGRAGGARALMTDHVTADQWPNWGVTDRGIYYVGYPDAGDPQLFFVDQPGAAPRPMTRLIEMAWPGIAVNRDGSRVIYARADRRSANIGGLILDAPTSTNSTATTAIADAR